jgi:hypothetical protein
MCKNIEKHTMIEIDDEGTSTSSVIEKHLEEKLMEIQQSIKKISISHNELWCTICSNEGHTKYYCKFNDALDPAVRQIQIETFYDICKGVKNHATRDFMHNMGNVHPKWCHICEENNHLTE